MKKIILGASILLTGGLLFLSACVASSNLGLIGGWNQHGRFLQSVSDAKLYPLLVISIIVMIAGLAIMIWGNNKDTK